MVSLAIVIHNENGMRTKNICRYRNNNGDIIDDSITLSTKLPHSITLDEASNSENPLGLTLKKNMSRHGRK
jgi:hypothetical protein